MVISMTAFESPSSRRVRKFGAAPEFERPIFRIKTAATLVGWSKMGPSICARDVCTGWRYM
jgi:hypothetical protein